MKYIKTYENDDFKDTIDFTTWCLTQKKYSFNKDNNMWLDLTNFTDYLTWEDIITVYSANKYNL
jgi:hypothetical protein